MYILAKTLAVLTGVPRYKIDVVWSNIWVSNLFRLYELLFWRRVGIRPEISVYNNGDGKTIQVAHSFEATCALIEVAIRNLFKFKIPLRVWLPILATTGLPIMASPFMFAIAADTSANGADTTATWTHVVTGSNPCIQTSMYDRNSNGGTVTYASVSMTAVTNVIDAGFATLYMWFLGGASTGSNSVTITTSSGAYRGASASYSGAQTSSTVDSFASNAVSGSGANTVTTTVVAANCWLAACGGSDCASGAGITSNLTDRQVSLQFFTAIYALTLSDSNATVGTGSQSIVYTPSGTTIQGSVGIVISIAPFVAVATVKGSGLLLMGVG